MIFKTIEVFEKQRRANANTSASVHAQGWAGLFSGFGSESVDWEDLLPYPDDMPDKEDEIKFSESTIAAIKRVLPQLPTVILGEIARIDPRVNKWVQE